MSIEAMPKIQRVREKLLLQLRGNRWKPGARLPSNEALARQFRCSVGTVGRALTILAHDGWIERKTRVGTRVIRTGSMLASETANAFAFVHTSTQHEGVWKMAKGFQDAAERAGARVVMLSTGTDYQKELEYLRRLSEFDVRGVMACPRISTPQELVQFGQLMTQLRLPAVLGGMHVPGLGCSAVSIDAFHVGYTMTRYLLDRGCRRIGFFSDRSWAMTYEKYRGYCWALEEAGLREPTSWDEFRPSVRLDFDNPIQESLEMARDYLTRHRNCEAVVTGGDFRALGLIAAAQEAGLRVPKDLKVTGVDDFALGQNATVPLTTYRVPYEEIGRRGFVRLQQSLSESAPQERLELVRGEVISRASA